MSGPAPLLPCPACGFLVHGEPGYGSYLICPLCQWEDCAIQLANPLQRGGPNRESLVACQAGALRRWPPSVKETVEDGERYVRDPQWRPLTLEEITFYESKAQAGITFRPSAAYWVVSPLGSGCEEPA